MSTPDRLRVFISSTYSDLREYRAAAAAMLQRMDLFPVRLEEFGAVDEPPLKAALDAVEASDIFIVLVAFRLGYIPPENEKSLVELEYEAALKAGKPVLCFLLRDDEPWPPNLIDPHPARIKGFRDRLKWRHGVEFFTTPDDLAFRLAATVSRFSRSLGEAPVEPPVAQVEQVPVTLDALADQLSAIRAELSILQQAVNDALRQPMASSSPGDPPASAPPEFLGVPSSSVDRRRCFVIMPYSQNWSAAVERIILEVCTEVGLEFHIAKNMAGRFIPNDIWRGITGAGVIVADLSGANPNVTYEIGLADVMGRQVILIGQETEVPFDFLAQRLIVYENSLPGSLRLREELTTRLGQYAGDVARDA